MQLVARMGAARPTARRRIMIGGKEECFDTIDRHVQAGVTHFIFMTFVPYNEDETQRFAEHVMAATRLTSRGPLRPDGRERDREVQRRFGLSRRVALATRGEAIDRAWAPHARRQAGLEIVNRHLESRGGRVPASVPISPLMATRPLMAPILPLASPPWPLGASLDPRKADRVRSSIRVSRRLRKSLGFCAIAAAIFLSYLALHPKPAHAGSGGHRRSYALGVPRDSHGMIKRSSSARATFLRFHGLHHTPAGCQVDHVVPLSKGGPDIPGNMRLLCGEALRAKERTERR
jgi:hypothetical protein